MNIYKNCSSKYNRLFFYLAIASMAMVLTGCKSAPWQNSSDSKKSASAALLSSVVSFTNRLPDNLVDDISNLKQFKGEKTPVEISIGNIKNNTKINFQDHFQAIATRLQNKLINYTSANDNVRFVRKSSSDNGYVLNGDFDKSATKSESTSSNYYMNFKINKPSGKVIFSKKYLVK